MSDGGKGSSPRPFSVTNEEYTERWSLVFGDKRKELREEGSEEADELKERHVPLNESK